MHNACQLYQQKCVKIGVNTHHLGSNWPIRIPKIWQCRIQKITIWCKLRRNMDAQQTLEGRQGFM